MVAPIITTINPAAAKETNQGRTCVMPGRVRPTAANTSAPPRQMRNAEGITVFIGSTMAAGGKRKIQPCAKKATASTTWSTHNVTFISVLHGRRMCFDPDLHLREPSASVDERKQAPRHG